MAKKTTTKKVKEDISGENVNVVEEVITETTTKVEDGEKMKMSDLSLIELQAYENLLRMLVLHYDKMLRLDDVEGRPVMSVNRNKFNSFSLLHSKLINYIEDKVCKLEKYEWDS